MAYSKTAGPAQLVSIKRAEGMLSSPAQVVAGSEVTLSEEGRKERKNHLHNRWSREQNIWKCLHELSVLFESQVFCVIQHHGEDKKQVFHSQPEKLNWPLSYKDMLEFDYPVYLRSPATMGPVTRFLKQRSHNDPATPSAPTLVERSAIRDMPHGPPLADERLSPSGIRQTTGVQAAMQQHCQLAPQVTHRDPHQGASQKGPAALEYQDARLTAVQKASQQLQRAQPGQHTRIPPRPHPGVITRDSHSSTVHKKSTQPTLQPISVFKHGDSGDGSYEKPAGSSTRYASPPGRTRCTLSPTPEGPAYTTGRLSLASNEPEVMHPGGKVLHGRVTKAEPLDSVVRRRRYRDRRGE